MTPRQIDVSNFLQGKDWTSPTEIGKAVWGPGHHSSSASPVCKQLVTLGRVERNAKGHYRLLRTAELRSLLKDVFKSRIPLFGEMTDAMGRTFNHRTGYVIPNDILERVRKELESAS